MYITRETVHLVSVIYIRLRKDFIMFNIRNISKSSLKYVLLGGGIIIAAAASVIIFCIIGDKSKSDITPISETAYMTIESSGYMAEETSAAGVSPLILDDSLCNAASMRSLEMDYAQNMSHTRPDGRSFYTVFKEFNISYRYSGENIAWGYTSPKSVVEAWKNSPSHYENMISSKFTKLGVGYSQNSQSPYWTQLFTD